MRSEVRTTMSPARQMPDFSKPPGELQSAFADAVGRLSGVEQRKMFGQPAAFANGQMFTGLFGPRWFLRLPDDAAADLNAMEGGGPFEVMPGRAMKGYVVLPPAVVADRTALRTWLQRSLTYARSLPPKPEKRSARSKGRARANAS
jgi:TfoX/Sxy family transcriptional regulator of competence genes